jgi:hypothetical protein
MSCSKNTEFVLEIGEFMNNKVRLIASLLFVAIIFVFFERAWGQLSPGELSNAHAALEGLKNCDNCHDSQKQISADKCLACHAVLKKRILAGRGLHAHADYQKCENCHVEHQGLNYRLIYWKEGRENFDHAQTGYRLKGKHLGLDCIKCHNAEHIVEKSDLIKENIKLDKTFLGLASDCRSCHRDEHRGQLSADCLSCHNMSGWKPAESFDHNKTTFPLKGKHDQVQCQKCHKLEVDNKYADDIDYFKFTNIAHANCTDCHQDTHNGRLGQTCQNCHNPDGWRIVNNAQFDHSKTNFPLLGKHANALCEKCHLPGKPLKELKFANCTDCHQDYHQGQFAGRENRGACEECHTVNGYIPVKFTIAQHGLTKYPLEGSHLAVPCNLCHKKIKLGNTITPRFKFESTKCVDCHKDPHKGQLDKYITGGGCQSCHNQKAWANISFDHNQTKFPLAGNHAKIACGKCHGIINQGSANQYRQFIGLTVNCQDCHKDIHRGQFALSSAKNDKSEKNVDCGKCHTPSDWHPEKFDHNRDAAFKLDGAHQLVACAQCHKSVGQIGQKFVLYKPIVTACKNCHGIQKMQEGS